MSRRDAYAALAAVSAAPRLAILLHERGSILSGFTEKSDTFAQVFVAHGTFGFLPGIPSAYTQPLYGWFLIPVYWAFGRTWLSVGLAQLVLAVVTAWLVYEIGRRLLSRRAALAAAAIATLNPYLAWHDMHVNREIVDQVAAAALVLLTLVVADRPSKRLALGLGLVAGLSMLGNTRLAFVPLLCSAYLVWRLGRSRATAVAVTLVLVGSLVSVAPWLIRNRADVGCWALTTDGRAMWKANNPQTYGLLSSGQWIDNISASSPRPKPPNRITPEEARGYYDKGRPDVAYKWYPDECVAVGFYTHRSLRFMEDHPGEKLKLAALSEQLLWQPNVFETSGRSGAGTSLDLGRRVAEPVYMCLLYALAAAGLLVVSRAFLVLALGLLAYQSACAAIFVGATRYRIAWDFLLALLAAAPLSRGLTWMRDRRSVRT